MCGIIGYVGDRRAVPIILEGLKRLEYRGYDSSGISFFENGSLTVQRCNGKLDNLIARLGSHDNYPSLIGLGHTRWATHGEPCERNAHPHRDCKGEITLVHNGIIENYFSLREDLQRRGHFFSSDTDTEVLAHLIEERLNGNLVSAVASALEMVKGSYAIGVMWSRDPSNIVAARNQSPLVIGLGTNEAFVASDIPAFLPWTSKVIYLDDGEIVSLKKDDCKVTLLKDGCLKTKATETINWNAAMAEKSGFQHFMLKEIYEQPQAILDTLSTRFNLNSGEVFLPEIGLMAEAVQEIEKIIFVACGTSYHAGLVGRYLMERWLKMPVEVELGSEFRYRDPSFESMTLTVPITQSGETADTLASLRKAKGLGSRVISICNVLGSTVTRESDGTIYTHAGPEIGVASTKAFTSQIAAILLLTLYMGRNRGNFNQFDSTNLFEELVSLCHLLRRNIKEYHHDVKKIAEKFYLMSDFLYLGRNVLYPIAMEGALKLKEISYIHAEGYAAGEMKHGPIALIDRNIPTVVLAPRDHVYDKMISNIEEVRARGGPILALGEEDDSTLAGLADYFVALPKVRWELSPILYTIPLQLLAYEIATLRGCDVDQPRNLAKSVTVE